MKKLHAIASTILVGSMILSVAAVGVTAASASMHPKVAAVNLNRTCSKGSMGNLQIQREDNGKLSIDVGVDMIKHLGGVPWRVTITDNSSIVATGTMHTVSDGSFSLTRVLTPLSGANHVAFLSRNLKTGETCSISATV